MSVYRLSLGIETANKALWSDWFYAAIQTSNKAEDYVLNSTF